eukprot:1442874-Rhodomonas_salina.2
MPVSPIASHHDGETCSSPRNMYHACALACFGVVRAVTVLGCCFLLVAPARATVRRESWGRTSDAAAAVSIAHAFSTRCVSFSTRCVSSAHRFARQQSFQLRAYQSAVERRHLALKRHKPRARDLITCENPSQSLRNQTALQCSFWPSISESVTSANHSISECSPWTPWRSPCR